MTEELGGPEDEPFFERVTVNVDALLEAAREEAYNRGRVEGESIGFSKGYAERGHDIVERLQAMGSDEKVIAEIEKMAAA